MTAQPVFDPLVLETFWSRLVSTVEQQAVALIRTALDPRPFGWIRRSAALAQLDESARMLLATLAEENHMPAIPSDVNAAALRWKHRFASTLPTLREAGIAVSDDVEAGAAEYVRLRAGWDARVDGLGRFLGYERQQVDVSTVHVEN